MKYRQSLRETAKDILPKGTKRREAARFAYRMARLLVGKGDRPTHAIGYRQWIENGEPNVWVSPKKYKHSPLVSVVVPTYNTPQKYLVPLVESLMAQTYQNWQLCIADGSSDVERAQAIETICATDERITYVRVRNKEQGIVTNTNTGIKVAKGEFVGFLDHDDVLSPHALLEVVAALNKQPKTDLFYSDEDKVSDDGKRRSHGFFKPDWSPQLLESVNYMTHFLVVRRLLLDKVGLLRAGFDGSQDYDFILRVTDATDNIVHIPKILYHWRLAEGSTSGPIENKDYANDAGKRALRDHVKRRNIRARVLDVPDLPTNYRLQYKLRAGTKASIIIPFKDQVRLTRQCVESILKKTTHDSYELILISNNSTEKKTFDWLKSLEAQNDPRIRVFYYDVPFNYSAINNFGRKQATGEYIVLLNNDTEVISGDWLSELLGVASQPWAGAVGPLLLYPNNKIQHAGVVLGMDTMAGHVWRHLPEDALTPFGRPYWVRNFMAVTAACLAVKASKYDEVGGLDESFLLTGQDVVFSLSLYEKGYRNVYWPFAKLYHYESVSVGNYKGASQSDYDKSLVRYRPYLLWHDPYFNPNLSLANEQIAYREDYSGQFN